MNLENKPSALPGIAAAHSEKILSIFRTLGPKVEVILFGSRAKGSFREGSDIDIALKGPSITLEVRDQLLEKYEALNLPWKLDVVIYSSIQEPSLVEHINRVGMRL